MPHGRGVQSRPTYRAELPWLFRAHCKPALDVTSDSYVYLLEGDCGRGVQGCFSGVTVSGPHRMMQVTVALDHMSDRDLMGMIGHELRHTIEAIEDPTVRNSDALFFLYQRIGYRGTSSSRETAAAVDVGNAVRAEIRKFTRSTQAE